MPVFCSRSSCSARRDWAARHRTTDTYSVRDFGAKGDGKTDDTAAFQKALDTAGQGGGGVVYAPRGNYFFAGHLNVPDAVTLKGVWESVPSHVGLRECRRGQADGRRHHLSGHGEPRQGGRAGFHYAEQQQHAERRRDLLSRAGPGRGAEALSLGDRHAREESRRAGSRTAQPLQRHRRQPQRAAPDPGCAGPAAAAGHLRGCHLRHRAD